MGKTKHHKREGQYISLSYFLLRTQAWRSLSGTSIKVLLELHTRFNGSNNGRVFLSMNEAAEILGMGKSTVQRAYKELAAKGFIVKTRHGSWYGGTAHEWRLTLKPVQNAQGKRIGPPSHDYKQWKPPPKKQKLGSVMKPKGIDLGPFENPELLDSFKVEPVISDLTAALGSKMNL